MEALQCHSHQKPIVLVTGGTGKQGGATVRQLLAGGRTQVRVLTRAPDSLKAQALAASGVEIVRGDLSDPASTRAALEGAAAACSVQIFEGNGGIAARQQASDYTRTPGIPKQA